MYLGLTISSFQSMLTMTEIAKQKILSIWVIPLIFKNGWIIILGLTCLSCHHKCIWLSWFTSVPPSKPLLRSNLYISYESFKLVTCCISRSNPPPSIMWFKRPLHDESPKLDDALGPTLRMAWYSTLTISGKDGSGIYVCKADNSIGKSEAELIVTAGERPPPNNPVVDKNQGVYFSLPIVILLLLCFVIAACKRR